MKSNLTYRNLESDHAKFCINCGKALPENAIFCSGCGCQVDIGMSIDRQSSGLVALGPPPLPRKLDVALAQPLATISCTACGSISDLKKASAIWESGTFRMDGAMKGGGVGLGIGLATGEPSVVFGGGGGKIDGIQQSYLAARLAPPARPKSQLGGGAIFLWIAGIVLLMFMNSGFPALATMWNWVFGIWGLGFWPVAIYTDEKSLKVKKSAWQASMASWNSLWYCFRCGQSCYI